MAEHREPAVGRTELPLHGIRDLDVASFLAAPVAATVLGDYAKSLAPLGPPTSIEPGGKPRLRGGFVNRNYAIRYPGRTLTLITYAEPGPNGRFEQYMIMPE